jgi:hypothetical protein
MAYPFQPMNKRKLLTLSGKNDREKDSSLFVGTGDPEILEKPSVKLLPLRNLPSSQGNPKYLPTEHRS